MASPLSRRDAFKLGVCGVFGTLAERSAAEADAPNPTATSARPFLTPAPQFTDVSRGTPLPHKLMGEDIVNARLTPETWRLEIAAENPPTLEHPRNRVVHSPRGSLSALW